MLDDRLFLYPLQVKHLWFQQKQIEAISQSVTVSSNSKDGNCSLYSVLGDSDELQFATLTIPIRGKTAICGTSTSFAR